MSGFPAHGLNAIRETVKAHDGHTGPTGWTLDTGDLTPYTSAFGKSALISFDVFRDVVCKRLGQSPELEIIEVGERAWREDMAQQSDLRWFRRWAA